MPNLNPSPLIPLPQGEREIRLFNTLIHGLALPSEILNRPGLSKRVADILTPLLALENEPSESLDFLRSYRALDQKPDVEQLVISNRVDLSELELAYLFKLADMGVRIRFEIPIMANQLAQRIEQRHDLKNLEVIFKPFEKPQRLVRYEAPDLVQESRFVAQVAAGYGVDKKIAVAMRVLDKRALIFRDALRAHGLNTPVLALPDLIGQQFDLVVIADCVHGRLAISREPDWPLRDSDSNEINRVMGRQVLRRFEEGAQWFLGGCQAAQELLVLTSSAVDEKSQAQSPSELTKLELLGENEGIQGLKRPLNKLEMIFERAKNKPSPDFAKAKSPSPNRRGEFRQRFGDLLGLNLERPLSATRIDALAQCRFRAFVEKFLQIDLYPPPRHDIDARVIGQLAHQALEKYYRDGVSVRQTLSQAAPENMHPGIWRATLLWLGEALERLISNLEKNPPIENARPVAFEHKLKPFELQVGEDRIFIGGVVDRVDQSPDADIVVDYKMSPLSALRIQKPRLQIPIYLRALNSSRHSIGYPISIKDGAPGPMTDMTGRFQELDQSLRELLGPVLNGEVPRDIGTSCQECRLKRVCRV